MGFDKTKVVLFSLVIVFAVLSITGAVISTRQHSQIKSLENDLKLAQTDDQTDNEKLIKDFYKTVYTYEKSQKEISMTTVKELATDNVYQELQNEMNVNNSYSPQQNTIQKSTINEKDIKILEYKTSDGTQQYLITAPIHQVFNGTKNDFDLNQIVNIKDQKITNRTTIQLSED